MKYSAMWARPKREIVSVEENRKHTSKSSENSPIVPMDFDSSSCLVARKVQGTHFRLFIRGRHDALFAMLFRNLARLKLLLAARNEK